MAVSGKGRRQLTLEGRQYVWFVRPDDEFPPSPGADALTVLAPDKSLLVRYHLSQSPEARHVTFERCSTPGLETGGVHRRFRCPSFVSERSVRPRDVRGLVEWCLTPQLDAQEVNPWGLPVD